MRRRKPQAQLILSSVLNPNALTSVYAAAGVSTWLSSSCELCPRGCRQLRCVHMFSHDSCSSHKVCPCGCTRLSSRCNVCPHNCAWLSSSHNVCPCGCMWLSSSHKVCPRGCMWLSSRNLSAWKILQCFATMLAGSWMGSAAAGPKIGTQVGCWCCRCRISRLCLCIGPNPAHFECSLLIALSVFM